MERSAFQRYLSGMIDAGIAAVDVETNGEDVRDGRGFAIGNSIAYHTPLGIFSAYFPWRHEDNNLPREWLPELFAAFRQCRLIFHHAKFDLPSLQTLGYDHQGPFDDTMIWAHLLNEEWQSKALDWLSKVVLKEEKGVAGSRVEDWAKAFGWGTTPATMMAARGRVDTELTLKLRDKFLPRLQAEELAGSYWDRESEFIRVIAKIEKTGILLDQEYCNKLAYQGENRMLDIEYELGFTPSKTSDLFEFLFGYLKLPVVRTTPSGKPSLNKEAMDLYDIRLSQMDNNAAQLVLEYRGWQKAVAAWYRGFVEKVSPDGRLRPNFNIHRVKTGRLSCDSPNLQQIPRHSNKSWNGSVDQCLIPKKGFKLIYYDYKALEFRLGAAYASEVGIVESINSGGDPHRDAALQLFGETNELLRYRAKTINFATIYGAGLFKLAWLLGLSIEDTEPIYSRFHESYPGFKRVSKTAENLAKQRGYVRYWTGRRRHFHPQPNNYHKAFNSIIQGGGAEIVKSAMINLNRTLGDDPNCQMVLQIHDAVIFEIKEDLVDHYSAIIKPIMEDFNQFGVKIEVESHEWGI